MKIAVLGCGNMAQALVVGIHKAFPEIHFYTYTPSFTRAENLAKKVGGVALKNLSDFEAMDYWLVACKPQQFSELSKELAGILRGQKVISILAAISLNKLVSSLETNQIIRIMPNTPSSLGMGISLMLTTPEVDEIDKKTIENIFKTAGELIVLNDEKKFDLLTTISGSGPAYIFYFAKAYIEQAMQMGLDEKNARNLVNQLFLGTSSLMKNDHRNLEEMIDAVTSKGGVTIEAINIFKQADLNGIVRESLSAAAERSKQITQQYS